MDILVIDLQAYGLTKQKYIYIIYNSRLRPSQLTS